MWSARRILALALALALSLQTHPALAGALEGIYHHPYGLDEVYSSQPTERNPRDPAAGDQVWLHATTWPVSPGQTVWVTWRVNGQDQTPKGFSWDYNSGNNSYWKLHLGTFQRGDEVEYTIHADVDGAGQRSTPEFSFITGGWATAASVADIQPGHGHIDLTLADPTAGLNPHIRLAFPSHDQIHVQVAPRGELDITGAVIPTLENLGDRVIATTDHLRVLIMKDPYRLELQHPDGTPITELGAPSWLDDGTHTTRIETNWSLSEGEHLSGLGERYDQLDQRGKHVLHYIYNQYRDQAATGRTYLSVPFVLSTAGYGLFVNTMELARFNLGADQGPTASFSSPTDLAGRLDYRIFVGTPEQIMDLYTAATTRPKLPPRWAFGLWMSANEWNTEAEVTQELDNVERHRIPHTAMVLEQWSDEATFYLWHGASYTPKAGGEALTYSDLSFPPGGAWQDPKAMIADAHNQGIRVLLWQIPVLKQNFDANPASPPQQHVNDRDYAIQQHYVVTNADGSPYRIPSGQWFGDSTVPDFTNAAAASWWLSKRSYLIDDLGVDGFKTDGGEVIFGRDLGFADGSSALAMHNGYPDAYTGAYRSFLDAHHRDTVLFSRAGAQGAQAHSVIWAGDQNSSFAAMREALRAGLSSGSSGVPFWSWDLAGFTGSFPSSELYLRAASMSVFTPVMQYHSEKANPAISEARTPWNVAARTHDPSVIDAFRRFASIRMSLLPYTYTIAHHSAGTGVPMMRAMSFAFPGDGTAVGLEEQYLYGDDLLVAPILHQGSNTKDLYLPEGEWYDLFNTGTAQHGWKNYWADPASIPVYVQAGAIVPMNLNPSYRLGHDMNNSLSDSNLTFRIYPHGRSSGRYVDAAGKGHTITCTEEFTQQKLSVTTPNLVTGSTLQIRSGKPDRVQLDNSDLPELNSVAELVASRSGWVYDPVEQFTLVKQPSGAAHNVVLEGVTKAGYEAEFGKLTGTATNSDHPGFSGTGFVDQFERHGDAVSLTINTRSTGEHQIALRYANATGNSARRSIYVDGIRTATVDLPSSASWDSWGTAAINVPLTSGQHTIEVRFDGDDYGPINLDWVGVWS